MTNVFNGRTEQELFAQCEAEYRFYRSSLRNYRPGTIFNIGNAGGWPGLALGNDTPRQGMCHGLPSAVIDAETAHFNFPNNFDTVIAAEAAFTIEYLGVPQDRLIPDNNMALVGENTRDTAIALTDARLVYINLGAAQTSDNVNWWWPDTPLHFVMSRTAGAGSASYAWINSVPVLFNGVAPVAAGDSGIADATGEIFNHADGGGNQHPFWGHHWLLRLYSTEVFDGEVAYLYRRAQKLLPQTLFRIPILGDPA